MKHSLDQILTFIHVVEDGNFTQAAEKMELSKAIVSQHIKALETHLQTTLFTRTTRKVVLTDAGKEFYHNVHGIFNQIEGSMEAVRTHQSVAKGNLRVYLPSAIARSMGDKMIPQFIEQYPLVTLDLIIVDNPLACLDRDFDCLILPHIKGLALPDFNFVAKSLVTSPAGLYATPRYIKQYGIPTDPEALLKHNGVAAFSGAWPFQQRNGSLYYVKPPSNVKVNNVDILHSIVMSGLAIGYAYPRLFVDEIQQKKVKPMLQDYLHLEIEVFAIYPQSYYMPYKLRVFLDRLHAFYLQEQKIITDAIG